ncbi:MULTISPECIES: aspartyl-phosphate phosphatase Spo0E family protein [Oceanobacillus]|nr:MULTISPECIES: aspartyl-phosphate phosphatase Spo0E family protein [Oceanobacillus]
MELIKLLEIKRKEMIKLAEQKGYDAPEVIRLSQEIDKIIIAIQKSNNDE